MTAGPCYVNDSGYEVHRFDYDAQAEPCSCGERFLSEWNPTVVPPWGWSFK